MGNFVADFKDSFKARCRKFKVIVLLPTSESLSLPTNRLSFNYCFLREMINVTILCPDRFSTAKFFLQKLYSTQPILFAREKTSSVVFSSKVFNLEGAIATKIPTFTQVTEIIDETKLRLSAGVMTRHGALRLRITLSHLQLRSELHPS